MRMFLLLLALVCACAADAGPRPGDRMQRVVPAQAPLLVQLRRLAPGADPEALAVAVQARACAIRSGATTPDARLGVIDYTRPSTQRRLWVFDVRAPRLLFAEYVAHGKGSGENFATRFSNDDGSLESSLGVFRTAETYVGENGYSLRMDGLEPGVNDHARDRLLVMHGAWYVDPALGAKQGRIGRSFGCPALRPKVAHAVIDALKAGQLLVAYYPDAHWLASSRFLHCDPKPSER
jgi:hypothetical protein